MKLSYKLFAGFLLISLLFTAVAIVNIRLSDAVIENTVWVSRSQVVVRNSASLQRDIIDMETGLRGFLLNGNETFLQPYVQAKNKLPSLFQETKKFISGLPGQEEKMNEIIHLQNRWRRVYAEPLIAMVRTDVDKVDDTFHLRLDSLVLGEKALMDSIRTSFSEFNAYEYQVRTERRERLNNSIINTKQLSTILTILSVILGLSWAYYITRLISGRIIKMVTLAEQVSQGDYKTQIIDNSRDELSQLSHSLNRMSATIGETFTELDRKNKELDQFAYVVSHDLKAPLRGIEVVSRWVEEDMGTQLPPKVQEYLMMMRIRVHRMENLINGILALARIGRTKQIEEEVDVNILLSEVVDMLTPPPGFRIEVQDNMPILYTIRIQLQQVFSNLINNAIKYHDKSEGLIKVTCQELDDFYEFSVADNGPGIDPDYHERIFVIFQTLQERDAVESTGVGLTIVKKIVEWQGGTIGVRSQPGQGATFTFTWPKK
ncbi:HAMP domain-containing protein [Pontibacter diazotrophicus]|uniref:histidine kinase n=1 Tax=Pontibacter diazotrophicus TaxID=1400979 RepID=A0A3D8LB41_9BACT|nr:CHASE3 domain-containing protein [Pontibacter diazotrophicus]RDV14625.1 HAMP domain-containing protein [Pontibacter diazotrophicus]